VTKTNTPKIIAIEGPGGAGKSTLARALAEHMGADLIKRPLATPPASIGKAELRAWMEADCAAALAAAAAATTQHVILDRHWLSACVYQYSAQWPHCVHAQARAWGEPAAWVILSADAHTSLDRLNRRAPDGRHHLDDPRRLDLIAGRIALYDDAPRHLIAPCVTVSRLPAGGQYGEARTQIAGTGGRWMGWGETDPVTLAQMVAAQLEGI
jgi:thymidylate kinase